MNATTAAAVTDYLTKLFALEGTSHKVFMDNG